MPAPSRMERVGQIKAEWHVTENNRRDKYYALTERGRKALQQGRRQWGRQITAINRIFEA